MRVFDWSSRDIYVQRERQRGIHACRDVFSFGECKQIAVNLSVGAQTHKTDGQTNAGLLDDELIPAAAVGSISPSCYSICVNVRRTNRSNIIIMYSTRRLFNYYYYLICLHWTWCSPMEKK